MKSPRLRFGDASILKHSLILSVLFSSGRKMVLLFSYPLCWMQKNTLLVSGKSEVREEKRKEHAVFPKCKDRAHCDTLREKSATLMSNASLDLKNHTWLFCFYFFNYFRQPYFLIKV